MRPTLHVALHWVAVDTRAHRPEDESDPGPGQGRPARTAAESAVCAGRWRFRIAGAEDSGEPRETSRRPGPEVSGRADSPAVETGRSRRRLLTPSILGLLVLMNLSGLPYYRLPLAERIRSPLHPWFKPSGYVGQSAGILAFALFCFLWLYPLRKKIRWLAWTGSLRSWLDLHVLAGLAIPLLGAAHASWRFEGLIGLGYGAMLTVCVSGLIGRYLYTHIPRGRSGLELGIREIHRRREALLARIGDRSGVDPSFVQQRLSADRGSAVRLGPVRAVLRMFGDDLRRWRAARSLRHELGSSLASGARLDRASLAEVVRLARRELALRQQVRMIDATQRVFRYWHVAHRPFAVTALLAVTLHVSVVVYLGVTWFR